MNSDIMTFTRSDDTVSMSPAAIDIDILSEHKRDAIKGWLAAVREDWSQVLRDRFSKYLSLPVQRHVAPHHQSYCPDHMISAAESCMSKHRKTKYGLCGVAYVATRYNVSCHELLFGVPRPVELCGRTKNFISLVTSIPDERHQSKIRKCLKKGFLDTNSPMYILKERCIEAGFTQGMTYSDICSVWFGSPTQTQIMEQIYAPNLPHRAEEQPENVAAHSSGFDMVLRDCIKYRVSADYLILQDYSDFAVIDGEKLSDNQKEWLSLYLCASPNTQVTAIALITKYLIKQAGEQQKAEK